MVAVPEAEVAQYLKKQLSRSNGLLIFGSDDAGVSTLAGNVTRAFPAGEEPLRLRASEARSDPAIVDDAFRAMSLLGDRRLIIVEGCEETHAAVLLPLVTEKAIGNFLLLLGGSLNKSSKLRAAAAESPNFGCVAVYADSAASSLVRIRSMLTSSGIVFGEEELSRFADLVGIDRGMAQMECDKLVLFLHPEKRLTLEAIEASCGDGGGLDADGLISAVLDGNLEEADRSFSAMRDDGDWRQVLILLQMHLTRLESLSAAVEQGSNIESAFRSLKPPVFFGLQKTMAQQLRIFSLADISRAQATVQQAILQSREMADLAEVITGRALMALAHTARQLRMRKAG